MQFHRGLLVVLCGLGLAHSCFAQQAEQWKPVVVTRFSNRQSEWQTLSVNRSQLLHLYGYKQDQAFSLLINLRHGKARRWSFISDAAGISGGLFWRIDAPNWDNNRFTLKFKTPDGRRHRYHGKADLKLASFLVADVRVFPHSNRVICLADSILNAWDLRTGRLIRRRKANSGDYGTLSHNGRIIYSFDNSDEKQCIQILSARTGKIMREVRLQSTTYCHSADFSANGRFIIAHQVTPDGKGVSAVLQTATGQRLWDFHENEVNPSFNWVASNDERVIFVRAGTQWQVRDFQTGTLLRRLPCVSNVQAAASSPDGSMLYSIAGGVLYRQRAR